MAFGIGDGLPVGQERIKLLYEEYVHYSWLKQVWDEPLTDKPELEPCCAAAFHGMELAFLLMAEFITDKRTYVAKRPRIEAMALDVRAQMQLLAEIVDGELEEEGQCSRASLTQDFPFDGCPPTTTAPARSPGLARLIGAVTAVKDHISLAELNSVIKVTLQVTSAFQAAFQRWTVGLGIEHQFNALLKLLGLKQRVVERETNLDYMAMFRPQVVEATLTHEQYDNDEDFFFRTIHLGTECWMFVANSRARSAAAFAQQGDWHIASARIMQAARVLHYLGDHVMTLTRMNLRDYLQLKVQLEGTSGAGSSQVRAIRGLVVALMAPLSAQVRGLTLAPLAAPAPAEADPAANGEDEDAALLRGIMAVYINCDKHAGLYNYAKALEDVESALLGGFYYKHYCLAANVIGSEARGTMRRAVAGLKSGYEKPLFPVLDAARCALGSRYDEELCHLKGKMMEDIMTRYASHSGNRTERQQAMIPHAVASLASITASITVKAAGRAFGPETANQLATANCHVGEENGDGLAATATQPRHNGVTSSNDHATCPETAETAATARVGTTTATNGHASSGCPVHTNVTTSGRTGTGRNGCSNGNYDVNGGHPCTSDAAIIAKVCSPGVSSRGLCPFMSIIAEEGTGNGKSEIQGVGESESHRVDGVDGARIRINTVGSTPDAVGEISKAGHGLKGGVSGGVCPFFS